MNKKDKLQLAVTGVLSVILVVIIAAGAGKKGKKRKRPKPVPAGEKAAVVPSPGSAAKTSKTSSRFRQLQAEADKMPLVRDPFTLKPIEGGEEAQPGVPQEIKFYLIGIAWDPVQPKAIINNKIVQVGSQLDRYTVMEITEDKVTLSDGTEKLELFLEL